MKNPEPSIRVHVDVTNPGQFFACCGLLELADRLWPNSSTPAEGWFVEGAFCVACDGTLPQLIQQLAQTEIEALDFDDKTSTALVLGKEFQALRLDWWHDDRQSNRKLNGKEFKVWAGQMSSIGIAKAMQFALSDERFHTQELFSIGVIAHDPLDSSKKVEPFYYDARRCPNAHSRDIGFSTNDMQMTTTAHPAVELLCLIGLQVARGYPTALPRNYDYFTWSQPIPANLLLPASTGRLQLPKQSGFRFEVWYRTGQKKHKAFRSALPISS